MKNYLNGIWVVRKTDYWNQDKEKVLFKTEEYLKMNNERGIVTTSLLNYEAFTDEDFSDLLKGKTKKEDEIGVWFEVEKPLIDKLNMKWRGKLGMDWVHTTNIWMLAGYTEEEKERLIDEVMRAFKETFGDYPKTVGAWMLDVYSVKYMTDKYNIDAVTICREQWGMDAISPWGGPYYGGYYPCKNNIICPAESEEEQISTPVFRFYVNDPIYCYYEREDEEFNGVPAGAVTQEPTCVRTGQNPEWLRWIWDCMFGEKSFGFSYFQMGHESSFGWDRVEKGLKIQHRFLDDYKCEYESVSIGEMGRMFKEKYRKTPARAVAALDDWRGLGNQSVWYNNSDYRINIFSDKEKVWIRDIHIFDESYKERYLTEPVETHGILYDNLPVMDGVRFRVDAPEKPGFYFGNGYIKDCEQDGETLYVKVFAEGKYITLKIDGKRIEMSADEEFELDFKYNCSPYGARDYIIRIDEKEIEYLLRRKIYSVTLESGVIDDMVIKSEKGKITMVLKK